MPQFSFLQIRENKKSPNIRNINFSTIMVTIKTTISFSLSHYYQKQYRKNDNLNGNSTIFQSLIFPPHTQHFAYYLFYYSWREKQKTFFLFLLLYFPSNNECIFHVRHINLLFYWELPFEWRNAEHYVCNIMDCIDLMFIFIVCFYCYWNW